MYSSYHINIYKNRCPPVCSVNNNHKNHTGLLRKRYDLCYNIEGYATRLAKTANGYFHFNLGQSGQRTLEPITPGPFHF